jgi:predicted O-methyltransferase YrrM
MTPLTEVLPMWLDTVRPLSAAVGYGTLGFAGDLGYEGKRVTVQGRPVVSAISAHAPARVLYRLGGAYGSFRCLVALNDDVPADYSHAHFTVLADGRQVAHEAYVVAGQAPRAIVANVRGAELLELVVTTGHWDWCHAVWIEPEVQVEAVGALPQTIIDCLSRAEITRPEPAPRGRLCVATVASAGFDTLLDDMLGSLVANGRCADALLVVCALGDDAACARVAAKYRATLIPCRARAGLNPASKALLYSIAHVVDAEYFICLDADMLVLDDLRPVLGAVEAAPEGTIYACREGNGHGLQNLGHALEVVYGGCRDDFERLLGHPNGEWAYALVVNDGLFAAGRTAMLALDGVIREMPEAARWVDGHPHIRWRNQFVFNLALARLQCGAELDATYNVQLHAQDVELRFQGARVRAAWRGREPRVLHFSGAGRHKYPEWKGLFASVRDPLVGTGNGDPYADFLIALRAWIARHGVKNLAWTFYGTTDSRDADVRDPGTMPLFGLLHYLFRSNGCVQVLESGTARGVSTACIASAVAHRTGGRVVTFDPYVLPERGDLWQSLPPRMGACIDARTIGSLEGMTAAIAAGERFDAALLDSIHTAEHVWAEFELAQQLVCPGGLIAIHDVRYAHGTVEAALREIEAAGYGVTRLWTAESGVPEDDNLGLAVIENRAR